MTGKGRTGVAAADAGFVTGDLRLGTERRSGRRVPQEQSVLDRGSRPGKKPLPGYDIGAIRLWPCFWDNRAGSPPACQLLAILLWMHNGLGYIYDSTGFDRLTPARKAMPQGRAQKEAKMSIEQFIDNEVKSNDVVLFMKGTPQFPQCGFSGQVVQILDHVGVGYKGLNVLESAELRNGIKTIPTGRPSRSSTSRASSSAAATSSARCSRPANCSSCSPTRASRSARASA